VIVGGGVPGVIGLDRLAANGNGVVDSFDSSAGPYGTGNKSSAATTFSNGAISLGQIDVFGNAQSAAGSVSLEKNGSVSGNVQAGTTISSKGTIGGTATPNSPSAPLVAPSVPPCSPFSPATGLSGGFSYDAAKGDLSVSGNRMLTLAGGTYCFHNVSISGGGVLTVAGPVKIVLTGKWDGSGNSATNLTGVPGNLQVWSASTGANGVTLTGGSGAYATFYAPRTDVTLSGGSALYGAVLGKTLTLSGGSAVHYDVRLLSVWAANF
jgi:hypothetical protein